MKKIILSLVLIFEVFFSFSNVFAEYKNMGPLKCNIKKEIETSNVYSDIVLYNKDFSKIFIVYGHNWSVPWEGYIFYNNGYIEKYSFNDLKNNNFTNYYKKRNNLLKENGFGYSKYNENSLLDPLLTLEAQNYKQKFQTFFNINGNKIDIGTWGDSFNIKYNGELFGFYGKIFGIKENNGKINILLNEVKNYKSKLLLLECGLSNIKKTSKNLYIKKNTLNKIESKKYDYITDLVYNKKTNSFAFVAGLAGKQILVKDFKEIAKTNNSNDQIISPKYSLNGKLFTYIIRENYKSSLVVNGKKGQKFDDIKNVIITDDGKYYSFIAQKYSFTVQKENKYFIIQNGVIIKESNKYIDNIEYKEGTKEVIIKNGYSFSPGKSFIERGDSSQGYKYRFNRNGVKSKFYDYIGEFDLAYSNKTNNYIMFAKEKGLYVLVKDGKEIGKYKINKIFNGGNGKTIFISENGKSYAFITEKKGKKVAIFNGFETDLYDDINNIILSNNGEELFFIAKRDKKVFFVKYFFKNNSKKSITLTQAKNKLKNTEFEKYISFIDKSLVKKSKEKLLKLKKNLEKLDFNSKKLKKFKDLFIYIKLKIKDELEKRS